MNQLKVGAALNYVSIILHMVVGLIYTPFMLRMLGQSEYGLYSLASSVIAYLTVLDLGFGNAIIRYTAKFRSEGKLKEQEEMFGMFLVLYVGIGLIAMIAGGVLAWNVESLFSAKMTPDEVERTRIMLWLMTFNLAFTFPMSIWGSIMSAYERFVFQRIISIIRSVLNPIIMFLLLLVGYKAVAMIVVTTIFNISTLIINWWYCKYRLSIRVRRGQFKLDFLKEISIYSFWIFLNAIMDRIYWSTGQFVLGIYRGAAAIAVYAVAIQLQSMYMMFSTAISGVFLPKVTAMVTKENNPKAISDLFVRTGRIQYIVMAFILSAFIVFGKQFIALWAGQGYEDAYIISLLFFIPLTVPLIQNLGITILQARNQMKFRSLLYIFIAVGSLGLSIPLTKYYGGIGCAIGTSIALTLGQVIIMNIYYQRIQRLNIFSFWKEITKMSIAPILMCFSCYYILQYYSITSWVTFATAATIFSLVYITIFFRFSMNISEKNLFLRPINLLISRLFKKKL